MKRRSIVSSLVLFVLLLLLTTGAFAAETGAVTASGTCGANLTWSLDSAGTLTISGTGAMEDYDSRTKAPWASQGSSVRSLVIRDGVSSIGSKAFYSCANLVSTAIPDSVTSIGDYAFSECSSLIRLTIPDSVVSIGRSAFYSCSSLMSITLPRSLTVIGSHMFFGCRSLTNLTLPSSITTLETGAFDGCESLLAITLPDGMQSIGNQTFQDCKKLKNITIPETVKAVGSGAFRGCVSLTTVTLPSALSSIEDWTFWSCENLSAVSLPTTVSSIGYMAFGGCSSLTSIAIPQNLVNVDEYAFNSCDQLERILISDLSAWCSITFASDISNPLYSAKNLYLNGVKVETLEIPNGVQVIKEHAFVNAECLTAVSVPKSVIGIAAGAFAGCTNIQRVYYEGSKADWEDLPISADNDALKKADIYYNATPSDYYCTVTCAVSPGGTVTVDKNTYDPGETVTVTALPFSGYRLDTILVDGTAISGNTFAAAKNHTVSAVFEKLPVSGGDETFRIGDISVCTASGEALAAIPKGECLATIPVTNLSAPGSVTVMIACYTAAGQYQGMTFVGFEDVPTGAALKVTTPISNSGGTIAGIKAFIVKSPFDITPVGNAVVFGL